MIILGLESSCDETAVAILETPKKIISSHVASQDAIHGCFGGVVPELASRRHMEMIVPLLEEALKDAKLKLENISAIAVTRAPGLIGALLVGLQFGKSLAYSLGKPLIGVNHLEGHLNAVHLEFDDIPYPHIGLVVSGGHTSLYLVKKFGDYKLLGATRDDAAGEAFDKAAKILGLGYPGGPIIDKIAKEGDPKAVKFTFPKLCTGTKFDVGELDFSFSGLKTALLFEQSMPRAMSRGREPKKSTADLAASFQYTVVEIICRQILKACTLHNCKAVVVSGGVAANSALRARLTKVCDENGYKSFLPSIKFCTDNAAMIAYVGGRYIEMGKKDGMDMQAVANEEIGI